MKILILHAVRWCIAIVSAQAAANFETAFFPLQEAIAEHTDTLRKEGF